MSGRRVINSQRRRWENAKGVYTPPPTPPPTYTVTTNDVVYDKYGNPLRTDGKFSGWGRHEFALGGVNAGFDWYHGARPGPTPYVTTNPGFEGMDYRYHNAWGQVVPIAGGMTETRVRVQVDIPQTYKLLFGGTSWIQTRGNTTDVKNFEGGYWSGSTFSKTTNMAETTHWRTEASGGHSFSVAPMINADGTPTAQSIAHWYYSGFFPRIEIPNNGAIAVYTRMRLISDTAGINFKNARFVGCFSADLFETDTTTVGTNGRNPPLAIPRHKELTDQWKPFTFVTGTEAQIRAYPALPFLV